MESCWTSSRRAKTGPAQLRAARLGLCLLVVVGLLTIRPDLAQTSGSWSTGVPMPTAREFLAAATGPNGRIYTIGGGTVCYADEPCDGNQTVRAFNLRTNTWTTLAPLHVGRFLPAAAVGNDGRIYVFGGEESIPRPWFEVYDPRKNRWTEVAGVPHVHNIGFAAAAARDGRIDLIGGCLFIDARPTGLNDYYSYCGDPSPVDAFDPRTNRWASIGVTLNARQGLAPTTGPDGEVYAVGGAGYGDGKLLEVIKSGSTPAARASSLGALGLWSGT